MEPRDIAILRADELMRRIIDDTKADTYRAFIGGDDNYRYQIYPEYKANRTDKPRPTWLQDVRAFLVEEWNAEIVNGMEADDAMGIEQCTNFYPTDVHWMESSPTIICTIDKDLDMIPGWHYNFVRGEKYFIDEHEGLANFYVQLILGDQSDNIPGYDGKMRPKVPKFLVPCIESIRDAATERDMYNIVLGMYSGEADRLLRNGRLLWLRRKEGEMWELPA